MHSELTPPIRRTPRQVRSPGGIFGGYLQDPLVRMSKLGELQEDIVSFRELGERFYLIRKPELVHEVLVSKGRHFKKGRSLERLRKVIGNGLLTSEGDFYMRQRRLLQPLFHAHIIRKSVEQMAEQTVALMEDWQDGQRRDISHDMMRLTLNIVSRTILGSADPPEAAKVREAMDRLMESFPVLMLPFAEVLEHLPIPAIKRVQNVRAELDRLVYGIIEKRRQQAAEHNDLLSMLLAAQDPESETGEGMTDEQIHDEVLIMILAGHETTATALSWTWFLLGQHPQVEAKLHAELDEVLDGRRLPTEQDYQRLTYTRQVIHESMRLYPPVSTLARRAIDDCEIGGYHVPARTIILMSQWLFHRDPTWFEQPLEFVPERWTRQFETTLPKICYFPFGGGLRRCIGENFALMELVVAVATIAHRWRFQIEDPRKVVPRALFTLRLKNGLPVVLQQRT